MYKKLKDLNIEVTATDLRALLFWATAGVNHAIGGSYSSEIVHIIESYSKYLGISDNKPVFGKYRRRVKV